MSKFATLHRHIVRLEAGMLRQPIVTGVALAALSALFITGQVSDGVANAQSSPAVFNHSTYSSPIAMSADNKLVWSVNPGDDSVSVIRTDSNERIINIKVGDEPQSVALDPSNQFAYVANAARSNVTVIKIKNANPSAFSAEVDGSAGPQGNITTGAEPWNIVVSPNGTRVFVANSGQDTITVIDAANRKVIGHVDIRNSLCNDPDRNRRFQPRGLSVTLDNSKLYVTRFFSFVKAGGQQGTDTGREGLVCRLDIDTSATSISGYKVAAAITLAPRLTGFKPTGPGGAFHRLPQSVAKHRDTRQPGLLAEHRAVAHRPAGVQQRDHGLR